MHKFIRAYDDQPTIPAKGDRKRILSTISELTPRLDPETLRVCASILASSIESSRKIVTEEHGAGHIAGALSFLNGNDIAIARWTSDGLADKLIPYFGKNAHYRGGRLVLQGVQSGDKVTIVDDVLDRGETLGTLINLIEARGATIDEIYVLAEKTYDGESFGRANLSGRNIKSLLTVEVGGRRSRVETANCHFTKYCDNPEIDVSDNLLHSSYEGKDLVAITSPEGREVQFMIVPLSEHYPCTQADLLREAVFKIGQSIPRAQIDKIVAEFDRCSHILGAVSLYTNMPIAGAKWFPGPESQGTAFSMEYYQGNLYPYGIQRGDTVYIIEDTVSSGGTLIGLINLLRNNNVYIEGAVTAVVKKEYKGITRIQEETGIHVHKILDVSITGDQTQVIYDRYDSGHNAQVD
jgi:adenine/guanine phosphoribosyltransferase-like PRPP-binding protein